MGSNIFNFDLETEGSLNTVIDLEYGCFTEDKNKKIIYHFPSDTSKISDKLLKIDENNNLIYKDKIIGIVSLPKSFSINLAKLPGIELIIREEY